jgi:hypothetical protein
MHNALTESMDMDANAASDCGRKLFLEFKHDADITPVYGELVRPAGLGVMANLMVVMTTWTCSGVRGQVADPTVSSGPFSSPLLSSPLLSSPLLWNFNSPQSLLITRFSVELCSTRA